MYKKIGAPVAEPQAVASLRQGGNQRVGDSAAEEQRPPLAILFAAMSVAGLAAIGLACNSAC